MRLTNNDIIRLKGKELEPTLNNLIQCHNHLVEHSIKVTDVVNKQTKFIRRNQKYFGLSLIMTLYLSLRLNNDEKRIKRLEEELKGE